MSTRVHFELNRAGIGELLKVNCKKMIGDLAHEIADNVNGQNLTAAGGWDRFGIDPELTAEVIEDTSDRARALVAINHPAALAFEAKYGTLTKAAAAAGLEVKGKGVGGGSLA